MRLQIIDFLKGYSIFTIVLMHLLQSFQLKDILYQATSFGGAGVHVFILCSGFGLCLSHMNKPLNYIQFFRKRFLKLYLPYIFIIVVSALIPFIYADQDKFKAVLGHVFLYKMFDEQLIDSFGGQFWFMSTIIQLYILFPVFYFMVRKWNWNSVILAIIISLCWATFVDIIGKSDMRIWNSFFLQYLWEFILGMLIALKYKENQNYIRIPRIRHLIIFSVIGIVLVGLTGVKGGVFKLYNDIPSLIGYISLSLLIYSFDIKWLNDFFVYTNRFSYEWYLIHILIFNCVFFSTKLYFCPILSGILALILSYSLALYYHKLIKVLSLGKLVQRYK